jgi:hypothetical protein
MTRSYLGYVSSQTTDTIVVQGYGVATGGTTLGSPPAGYTVLEFTSSGTLDGHEMRGCLTSSWSVVVRQAVYETLTTTR